MLGQMLAVEWPNSGSSVASLAEGAEQVEPYRVHPTQIDHHFRKAKGSIGRQKIPPPKLGRCGLDP